MQATLYDNEDGAHQSFLQIINGYTVEASSMVIHIDADGEVIGVNGGECADATDLSTTDTTLSPSEAVEIITAEYVCAGGGFNITGPALPTVVRSFDGDLKFCP
jgi:Zn-dependent metalloprotease